MNDSSYANYEAWKQWDQEAFGTFNTKKHYYFKGLFNYLGQVRYEKIMEVGFGNGDFAGWLKATHPDVHWYGIEKQENLVAKAKHAGFDAEIFQLEATTEEQYDLIVAFDVIEHLTDKEIKYFFTKVAKMLKQNGVVLIRAPNGAGPLGLPNQNGDATHITPISVSRLTSYLSDWHIEEQGDLRPIWSGKFSSAIRDVLRLAVRKILTCLVRFAFSPQPKTLLASNLHLFLRPKLGN